MASNLHCVTASASACIASEMPGLDGAANQQNRGSKYRKTVTGSFPVLCSPNVHRSMFTDARAQEREYCKIEEASL